MTKNKKIGIIGGDVRQIHTADNLKKFDFEVSICGFDKIEHNDNTTKFQFLNLKNIISDSNYIVLPVPVSRDGINIYAPFSDNKINIDENFIQLIKKKVVFGGIIAPLISKVNKKEDFLIKDYYKREDFLIPNAYLTAEGTIKTILQNYDKSINKSEFLVIGYGRIGKILSNLLKNMGGKVTISTKENIDVIWSQTIGFDNLNINKLEKNKHFDVILNTVPEIVLNKYNLNFLKSTQLIIDIASSPGGIDINEANNLKIKVLSALGLPGKHFPKSAGEITANVINRIIMEENL